MTRFSKQFDGSETEKKAGKAQFGFDLQPMVVPFSPSKDQLYAFEATDIDPHNLEAQEVFKYLSRASIFGFGDKMTYNGPEYMGGASLRVQIAGSRKIIMLSLSAVQGLFAEAHPDVTDKPTLKQLRGFIGGEFSNARISYLLSREDVDIAIIGPGDSLYTPSGYWVLEETAFGMRGWGVRFPLHIISQVAQERLEISREMNQSILSADLQVKALARAHNIALLATQGNQFDAPAADILFNLNIITF